MKNLTPNKEFEEDFIIVDKELAPLLSGKEVQEMCQSLSENHCAQQFPDGFNEPPGTLPGKKVFFTALDICQVPGKMQLKLNFSSLRVVLLSLSPSCVTRKKAARKNRRAWGREARERNSAFENFLYNFYI